MFSSFLCDLLKQLGCVWKCIHGYCVPAVIHCQFSYSVFVCFRRSGHEVAMESVYLAAGCRLLSAALIPNPKLNIRYTAASQEQEQLFNLDRGSAAKWFSHNRSWAQGLWENSHTLQKAETAF